MSRCHQTGSSLWVPIGSLQFIFMDQVPDALTQSRCSLSVFVSLGRSKTTELSICTPNSLLHTLAEHLPALFWMQNALDAEMNKRQSLISASF